MKRIFLLVVVNTLDDLRSDEGAFGDNALEGHHMVEVGGGECSRIAGVFAKRADICAVVHLLNDRISGLVEVQTVALTTSSDDSMDGLPGSAATMFLSA